jgi:hypothetical protein
MMAKEHFGHRAICGRECLTSFGMKRFTDCGILHELKKKRTADSVKKRRE